MCCVCCVCSVCAVCGVCVPTLYFRSNRKACIAATLSSLKEILKTRLKSNLPFALVDLSLLSLLPLPLLLFQLLMLLLPSTQNCKKYGGLGRLLELGEAQPKKGENAFFWLVICRRKGLHHLQLVESKMLQVVPFQPQAVPFCTA